MKNKPRYRAESAATMIRALVAACFFGFFAASLMAQQLTSTNETSFRKAIASYREGKPQRARELLAGIDEKDPNHALARCYNALCLFDLKDYQGCLKEMESPEIKAAAISTTLRTELGYRRIDVLFHFRKFEDILTAIQDFRNENPNSDRLKAVNEYSLAALFERGMKKAQEAAILKDVSKFQARWAEAQTNLQDFLSLSSILQATNYRHSALSNRAFSDDIWAARIALGDEAKVTSSANLKNPKTREKFSLLRIRLYQKLRENEIDENLKIMSEFLQEFPTSAGRRRVEFDIATYRFKRAERLYKQADGAEKAGDPNRAAGMRAAASGDLQTFRSLQKQAMVDRASGIESTDVLELQGDLLNSYILEKDYTRVASLSASIVSGSKPGDLDWLQAKTYAGIALQSQSPPRTDEAATVFDQVLRCDFDGSSQQDYYVLTAAKWRVQIAVQDGDLAKAQAVVQQVLQGKCRKEMKRGFLDFLKAYPDLAPLPNVETQTP